MALEIPRPSSSLPSGDPIEFEIEIPPPEVGIKRVTIPGTGILVVDLTPYGRSPGGLKPAVFSNSNYSLRRKGASSVELMAWFADGSIYSAKASDDEVDGIVANLNQGLDYAATFHMHQVVAATQENIVPTLAAIRLRGDLSVDYGASGDAGIGTIAWGYHIDVQRLQELVNRDSGVAMESCEDPAASSRN